MIKNFEDSIIDKFIEENNIKNILMEGSIGEFLYKGIEESKGEIISFLDDDDLFYNTKLEHVYNLFKNMDIVYYHNGPQFINDSSEIINKTNTSPDFNISCISIRKDMLPLIILREITMAQDLLIYYISLDSNKKIIYDNILLTYYRFHST